MFHRTGELVKVETDEESLASGIAPDARRARGVYYTPAPLVTRASRPGVLFSSTAAVGPGGWRRPEGGDAAFCRSDDGGQSWMTLQSGLPQPLAPIPRAIAVDPLNPRGYLAGLTDGSIWATDDDGASFQHIMDSQAAIMAALSWSRSILPLAFLGMRRA